jgi:hypothetical protein
MADGDQCGLALFRDSSAWIGVVRNGNSYTVTAVQGLTQNAGNSYATTSTGTVVGTAPISARTVYLQIRFDSRTVGSNQATFYYSTDGNNFSQLGGAFTLDNTYYYFMGYRYGIFNFATKALGGSVKVDGFVSWSN